MIKTQVLRRLPAVRTLNAGPNPRYFGTGRGGTYYNFTSDQFTGFHAIVVPGTIRDSLYVQLRNNRVLAKLLFSQGHLRRRNPEMLPKNPPELQDVDLPSQQFMLGQNQTKQVSAEASLLFLRILVTFAMGLRLE